MVLKTLSLDDGYVRPPKTYTEGMNPASVASQLQDYRMIDKSELQDIHLGAQIKYFIRTDEGKFKYRLGGTLVNRTELDKGYIVLMSGYGKKWCVQLDRAVLFVKRNNQEIIAEYKQTILNMKKYIQDIRKDTYVRIMKKRKGVALPRSYKKYGKQIDPEDIRPLMIIRGVTNDRKNMTQDLYVTGLEKYKNRTIGIRYYDDSDIGIINAADYDFIMVGMFQNRLIDQILKNTDST